MPPHGHAQHLQSPPGMDSVNKDNNLIKFNRIANTDTNCNNLDNSVNSVKFTSNAVVQFFDENVSESGISALSVLAEHAGSGTQQCSKNSDNNNVLAFGSCVRPAVEGDTNSWKKSKCKDLYHESWLDKYNIQSGRGNSTFLLCDLAGVLVGTCTRSFPNLDVGQLVNIECTQAMLSVYEIGDIFGFGCSYIVQIRGSRHQHVNGVYHICWNEGLKAYVFQRKVLEWGVSCDW